jgi:CheY-like chemotaxis protein
MVTERVLYVDDDLENIEMMKEWIRVECGCDAVTVTSGAEASRLMETEFFDVFIFDYCLPDITAVGLCSKVRALSPDAKVIIYSALEREVDKEKALAAGADHYLVKPDDLDKIKGLIRPCKPFPHISTGGTSRTRPFKDPHSPQHRSRFRSAGIV